MSGLVEWLRAQLDEDERVARAAAPDPSLRWTDDSADAPPAGWNPLTHIARWDPARVLAEVDAKRRILGLVTKTREWTDGSAGSTAGYAAAVVSDTLRLLALPYAGRPGYQPEWAPDGQAPSA